MEVISYVCCSFMGCGYVGVHPISKQAKMLIILLSLLKFIIIIEVVMYASTTSEHKNVYLAVKDIVQNAQKSVNS